jgi:hypothetical protein
MVDRKKNQATDDSFTGEMPMKRTLGLTLLGGLAVAWLFALNSMPVRAAKTKKGTRVTIDGLTSVAPAEWKEEEVSETARKFRVNQFRLPRVKGDKYDGEVVIFSFAGGGGSVKANVARWQAMFNPPKGKKIDDVTEIDKTKAGKVPVTFVDIQGSYKYSSRPFDPNAKKELRPDYRMVNAIFEGKESTYFFRLLGPEKTVKHYKKGFETFVKSFK